jgi:hypothetical protein
MTRLPNLGKRRDREAAARKAVETMKVELLPTVKYLLPSHRLRRRRQALG